MAKGYQLQDLHEKLVEILSESKIGLSGIELAERLKINRATMAKYLNILAAEGIIHQKNIGTTNLWFVDFGTENLQFPADYFRVKEKFLEYMIANQQNGAYSLIRNALYSGAQIPVLISEVLIPALDSVEELYIKAKIGTSESKMLRGMISNSLQILNLQKVPEVNKNIILISSDPQSLIYSQAASCWLASKNWQVWDLGDVSDAIDVLYDLDLQKFITKIWKQKKGVMVIAIFSGTEEGAKFFSESANTIKQKFGKNLHVVVHSRKQKQTVKAEFSSEKFESVLNWVDSISFL